MLTDLPVPKPTFCCINISHSCNLRCKMCFLWRNKADNVAVGGSDLEQRKKFILSLKDLTNDPIEVNFSGAEALLDDRVLPLINLSVKHGFYTSLCTNGFLIDENMAQKIADSGLNSIIISLDGINEETHDYLRGVGGCHKKVMRAIALLYQYCGLRIKIGIQSIILKMNLDEILLLVDWVKNDERIKFINFQVIVEPLGSYPPVDNEWYNKETYGFLWPKDLEKVNELLDELKRFKSNEKYGFKLSNSPEQLENFKRYFKNPRDFIGKNKCNADSWMSVNRSGDVYMCETMGSIGNINNDSARDMWYSKEADRVREEIRNCRNNCHLILNCCG